MVEEIFDGDQDAVNAAMNQDVDLLKMHTSDAGKIAMPSGLEEEAESAKQDEIYEETAMNMNGFFSDANDTVSKKQADYFDARDRGLSVSAIHFVVVMINILLECGLNSR